MFFEIAIALFLIAYLLLLVGIIGRKFWPHGRSDSLKDREETLPGYSDESSPQVIEVINVKKAFDHPVLKGVTLAVGRGETVGILGRSGTGKSVLLKLMAGFLQPDSGMILYNGREITQMSEKRLLEFRKRVSYVFQGGAFFDFLNVSENIAYPLRERGIADERLIRRRVDYLIDAVELDGMGDYSHQELNAGAKKQAAIARAIANEPEVILYDEPTTGVDPIIGKSLSRLIRKLNRREHLTSVVVTHDLKCLEIVADRIILLEEGRIHFAGTPEEFESTEDPFVFAFRTGRRLEMAP